MFKKQKVSKYFLYFQFIVIHFQKLIFFPISAKSDYFNFQASCLSKALCIPLPYWHTDLMYTHYLVINRPLISGEWVLIRGKFTQSIWWLSTETGGGWTEAGEHRPVN